METYCTCGCLTFYYGHVCMSINIQLLHHFNDIVVSHYIDLSQYVSPSPIAIVKICIKYLWACIFMHK